MADFQEELEEKMERFELNLRTLSEAKRKYSVNGLFGWINSPRSTVEEGFDPFPTLADEVDQIEADLEHAIQLEEEEFREKHEEPFCVEDHIEHTDEVTVEAPEDAADETAYSDLIFQSETSMSTMQGAEGTSLPQPSTKTEVAIHDILSGMMDTVRQIAVNNKSEAHRMDRKLRRRQSRMLTRMPSVDVDVNTAVGEADESSPKTSMSPLVFDAEFPRVEADRSLMRKPALTDALHEPVEGPNRIKRKRTLGPYTQVKVSASEGEDASFSENSAGTTPGIYYKEYRPSKLRPYPQLNSIGRRLSDEAVNRHRRMHKRRPAATPAAMSSQDTSPRPVVELFLNPWAASGGAGAQSSASDEQVTPTPRVSWRAEPPSGNDAKRADEQSSSKEQSSPREVSPRVPIHRRPKPGADAPPARQRISWRSDAVVRTKAAAATTARTDAPVPGPAEVDSAPVPVPARKPRIPRRKTTKPAEVEEKVEQVAEPDPVEPEPPVDAAPTTEPPQRARRNRTLERQQRRQQRDDEQAELSIAKEVAARVRAQRAWLRAQEELSGEEAILTRSYELPTVSSVIKRVAKSYVPSSGLVGIPFVVGTSTSPTHHCGLKKQTELRLFNLKLPNKIGVNSSAVTTCTESELAAARCCPAAANSDQCPSSSVVRGHAPLRPEDRWGHTCTGPNCTCGVHKTEPADKVLHQYVESRTQMRASPSHVSRLDMGAVNAAMASTTTLPVAASLSNTGTALSKTDLHSESLQTLKVKIGGLKECLVRLQTRFTRLHEMRNDPSLDLTEKQIADLERKIENKEQEINVVLALMREIFSLSRSQKTSVVSMAESTRSRRSRAIVGGGGRLGLHRK